MKGGSDDLPCPICIGVADPIAPLKDSGSAAADIIYCGHDGAVAALIAG